MEEIQEFTVYDRLGPLTFRGKILAVQKYGGNDKIRWTDMTLYQIIDPRGTKRPASAIEGILWRELTPEEQDVLTQVLPRLARRVEDTQPVYRYALENVARSFVYHRFRGPCMKKRHTINTVGNVRESKDRWRNLFPCPRCEPGELEDMTENDRIAEERTDSHVTLCVTASDIIGKMYRRTGEISGMAAKLLRQAAAKDPELAQVLASTRKV